MIDIQSWRRHTQLAKIRSADIQACCSPPDDNSLSTSPTDSTRPRPRRSLASFASYLSTHRAVPSITQPEWPSIDWSALNEKGDVYRPDPDHMCDSLRQHVLANPSEDLPAQYNSFVFHAIEAYQCLKSEKKDLERKLQAEEQCHQADIDEFRQAALTWSTADGPRPPANANSRFLVPIDHGDGQNSEKKRNSAGKLLALLPRIDTGYSRKWSRYVQSQTVEGSSTSESNYEYLGVMLTKLAPGHHESQRPSSQLSWHSGVVAASQLNDDSRPHSASTSSAVPKNLSPSSTESESSSDDEDHMALTSIAIAVNDYSNKGCLLSQQFEYSNDYQPEDIPSKASAIRSSSSGLQSDGRPEGTADSPSDLASTTSTATTAKESSGPRRLMEKAHIQPSLLTAEAIRKRRQHRGFSFMPGDDFGLPVPPTRPDAQPKESHSRASTSQMVTRDGSSERKASNDSFGSQWTANIAPVSGPYPQLTKSVVSLAEREQNSRPPKREGSSKSVLTAIKESSSRSSSLSHKGSMGSVGSKGSSSVTQKTSGDNSFAIAAAARAAARNRQK